MKKNFELAPDGESLKKKQEDLVSNIENIEDIEQQLIELRGILDRESRISNSAQRFEETSEEWIIEAQQKYIKEIKNKVEKLEKFLNIQNQQN